MARRASVLVLVHVVFSSEHRKTVHWPAGARGASIETALDASLRDLNCAVLSAGAASDHVHAVLRLAPHIVLADAVERLKRAAARVAGARVTWDDAFWAESLGVTDLEAVCERVRSQRDHDDGHPVERWQLSDEWQVASGLPPWVH